MRPLKIFSGSSHPALAQSLCEAMGLTLSGAEIKKFSNENLLVRISEDVRGCDTCVLQTATTSVHDNLVELLLFLRTLKQAGAHSVCAILPYFPYVRSDKIDRDGICIAAKLMAELIEAAGCTSAILVDLHSPQQQGFFSIPTFHRTASEILCDYLSEESPKDAVLVAPDAGEVRDLIPFARRLRYPMAIVDKRRFDDSENPQAVNIVGDVKGKTAILVDDEISSGMTMRKAAALLRSRGAAQVWIMCTHAVFTSNFRENLEAAKADRIVVTDTLPLKAEFENLVRLSTGALLASALRKLYPGY